MLRVPTTPRDHLLLPSHPTPNGRLHLGHVAGPYLKMDVLRRALQRRGDRAVLMFAIDSFESYVVLRAHQLGIAPGEVVSRYAREIKEDLAALDIETDLFLDPLDESPTATYRDSIIDGIEKLRRRSAIENRAESFLYCPATSRYIVGCWLLGRCPDCGLESGGYSCEACAAFYRPEELTDKRSRLEEGPLETVTCRTLFMRVHDDALLRRRVEELLPAAFQKIVRKYLDRSGATLRVSVPGNWGVPVNVEGEAHPQVVYSGFASLGLLDAFGREYARRFGKGNPFRPDSDVVVTCSFGIDNTVSRVMSCVGSALGDESFRPPDALLLNYFYRLEGAKFSTSRNHAIWASDIGNISPTMPDIVRLHMLQTSPEESETEFSVSGFLATAKELFEEWHPVIQQALSDAAPAPVPEPLVRALEDAFATQESYLDTSSFRSRLVPDVLRHWISLGRTWAHEFPYWWLKGFAVLGWPVLPKLCSSLWLYLGHEGAPTQHSFLHVTQVRGGSIQLFQPISAGDLQPCLPTSLKG